MGDADHLGRVALDLLVDDVHRVAVEEPQLRLPRRVEGERPCVADPEPVASGPCLRRFVEIGSVAVEQRGQAAVQGEDRLGCAGGTGGVHDVGRVVGAQRCEPVGVGQRGVVVAGDPLGERLVVEREHRRVHRGQRRREFSGGEHDDGLRGAEDRRETLGGSARFECDVGAAGDEHREHRRDRVGRAGQHERHAGLGSGTVVDEQARPPADPGREVGEGPFEIACHERRLVRVAGGRVVEQVRDGNGFGGLCRCGPPLLEPGAFVGRQHVDGGQAPVCLSPGQRA